MTMTTHKSTAVSLLPCPFCGEIPKAHQNGLGNLWHYRCENCDAGPHGAIGKDAAANSWNRRAALAAQPEESTHPTDGWVTVPRAALDWLFGEGPDQDGNHFGDGADEYERRHGTFWWRKKFRAMLSAAPAAPGREEGWFRIDDPDNPPPKDGTEIVAYSEHTGTMLVRFIAMVDFLTDQEIEKYANDGASVEMLEEPAWFCADFLCGDRLATDCQLTHWRPLPSAPAKEA